MTPGLFDNLGNLLGGSGRGTVPVVLRADEFERRRVVAAALFGGMSKAGGDLIVTNQRVVFTPLDTRDVSALLRAGLKAADAPNGASAVVGWLQRYVDGTAAALDRVTTFRAGHAGSLLKPPSIIFGLADGRSFEFGVLAGRVVPNGARRNREVRDQLISELMG